MEAAKGKAKASDTTSENHGGHSGATFAYAGNPFKVVNSILRNWRRFPIAVREVFDTQRQNDRFTSRSKRAHRRRAWVAIREANRITERAYQEKKNYCETQPLASIG